ncbi:MAG: ATP-binding protein, partial [Chloroflexota bacterium]|nr:ATP-binding protein [Chloroflexota bacterium]
RLGLRHVEVDAIVRDQGGTFGPDPLPRVAWVEAYREGHRRLGDLLAGGEPAVWDAVSFRWSHREALRRLATRSGRTSRLVWVDPAGAEIGRRRAENRLVPRRGDVPEAEFAGVAAGFQAPRPEEGATRYDPEMMTLDDLVAILTGPGGRDGAGDAAARTFTGEPVLGCRTPILPAPPPVDA